MKKFAFFVFLLVLSCAVQEQREVKDWRYYYDLGMSSYVAKNYSDAIANFYKAVQLSPKEPKVWNALGLAYMEAKEFQKAESAFQKALEVDPSYTEAKMNLGILYYNTKDYQRAKSTLLEALKDEAFSQKHMAYYYLAKAYKELGERDMYLNSLEKATAYNPLFLEAQMELAQEYEKEGNYLKARDVYNTLLNNNVDNPIVLLGLARVNFELGNYDASKNIIKTIIERKDTDSLVKNQAYELLNKVLIKEQEKYIQSSTIQSSPQEKPKDEQKVKVTEENPTASKVFSIQVGSFSSYVKAEAYKKRIETYLKDVRVVEQSGIYKVLYGRFSTREEAEKEQKNILKNFNILGFIVEQ